MHSVALLSAMRAGDLLAWDEYHERFRPLLVRYARKVGVPAWLALEMAVTVLDDVAWRLVERKEYHPPNLAGYLCLALRRLALLTRRAESRRQRYVTEASTELHGDLVVRSLCSADALRVSEGIPRLFLTDGEDDPDSAREARRALAAAFLVRLSDDDRQLLTWMEEAVPCRQIALWLGLAYDTAAKRMTRLRRRLIAMTPDCIGSLSPELQRHVRHLLTAADTQPTPSTQPATHP
ncbi:MAG: hypothetical protein H0W68_06060 [Gemmatimonadaceae bacterium]|nr:hypothetical protein [Gemmatimonadaceae bacterium]